MPKKRNHGDGGLYYLKSRGLWRGVVDDGFKPDGTRRQRYVHGKSQAETRAKLKDLKNELENYGAPLDKTMTVEDWATHWIENICRPAMKPRALSSYESQTRKWIVPTLRKKRVAQLKPSDIRTVSRAMFEAGLQPASVRKCHAVMSSMFEDARKEGLVARNVVKDVEAPSVGDNTRGALSTHDALQILRTAAQRPDGTRWWVALLAGMRQGERLGATIDSIDFENHMFVVQWSLTEVKFDHGCGDTCGKKKGGNCPERKMRVADDLEYKPLDGRLALVRPKSGKPRAYPLIPQLEDALRRYIESDTAPNPHGLIWRRPDGRPWTANMDQDAWREILHEAGVITADQALAPKDRPAGTPETPTTHFARHTTATVLMELGVDVKVIGAIVGHAAERTTRGYQHVSEPLARAAMEAIGAHYQEALGA